MSDIVPFGKYKGKSIETMIHDKQYVEWLMGQGWFQQHNLYTIVVNNFGEASETPEHNAMQALFLDDNFSGRFIVKAFLKQHTRDFWDQQYNGISLYFKEKIEDQKKRIEEISNQIANYAPITDSFWQVSKSDLENNKKTLDNTLKKTMDDFEYHQKKQCKIMNKETFFEKEDIDIQISGDIFLGLYRHGFNYRIELKPQVGDDYPAVLRGMKRKNCDLLVLKQYTGTGATREQFVAIFESSGIRVLFLDEIQNQGEL